MIIQATEHEFIMITQHDHGYLAGEFAAHFSKVFIGADSYLKDFLIAVYEHDRGWIELDQVPIWNEAFQYPYTFMDYPMQPRLSAYAQGLDEIEAKSEYAGLLCSLHYNSIMKNSPLSECIEFYKNEAARQQRIREKLRLNDDEEKGLAHHFQLLQYCDDLSLYVCLNEPGVDKDKEHPWYKDGFLNYKTLYPNQSVPVANWVSSHDIVLTPFPFGREFSNVIRLKRIQKSVVIQKGIAEAYDQAEMEEYPISFRIAGSL